MNCSLASCWHNPWIEDNPQPIGFPAGQPPSLRCGGSCVREREDQCRSEYDLEWDYKKIGVIPEKAQLSTVYGGLSWQKRAEQESLG